jgi:hypothetical protein
MTNLERFIVDLHFCCIAVGVMADDDERPAERIVNYLHQCLASAELGDKQRDIVERMAARVATKGLDVRYGAYASLREES